MIEANNDNQTPDIMTITNTPPVVENFTRHQTYTVEMVNTTWKITVTQTRNDTYVTVKPYTSTPIKGVKFDSFESAIQHYRSDFLKQALRSVKEKFQTI